MTTFHVPELGVWASQEPAYITTPEAGPRSAPPELVQSRGGPAWRRGDEEQVPGAVCSECHHHWEAPCGDACKDGCVRTLMMPAWCESVEHPTFHAFGPKGGHLIKRAERLARREGKKRKPRSKARAHPLPEKACAYDSCGRMFTPSRRNQAYHSEACKQRAKRARA